MYWEHERETIQEILSRSKEPYYRFEPYYKRSNGEPSWQWDFLLHANSYGRVALGANRIGKSEMGAYECVLAILGEHPIRKYPDEGIGWIIGLDNNMLRDVDRPIFERYIPEWVKAKSKYYKQDNLWVIETDKRFWRINFKSTEMEIGKFAGAKIDFAWVDEEPKRIEIFAEIEARLVDKGGNWWMTATPMRGTKWLKELSERTSVYSTFAGMRENPYLPEEFVEQFASQLSDEERDVRVEGKYIIWGGKPIFNRNKLQEMSDRIQAESMGIQGILKLVA